MVVVVNDLFSLIVVLEIMTLAFASLALYKHDFYQEPQRRAGTEPKTQGCAPRAAGLPDRQPYQHGFLLVAVLCWSEQAASALTPCAIPPPPH